MKIEEFAIMIDSINSTFYDCSSLHSTFMKDKSSLLNTPFLGSSRNNAAFIIRQVLTSFYSHLLSASTSLERWFNVSTSLLTDSKKYNKDEYLGEIGSEFVKERPDINSLNRVCQEAKGIVISTAYFLHFLVEKQFFIII